MERCRSCGAPIIWRRTKNGRFIPCDPDEVIVLPVPTGGTTIGIDSQGNCVHGILAKDYNGEEVDGIIPVLISHFATCPDHAKWRKKT